VLGPSEPWGEQQGHVGAGGGRPELEPELELELGAAVPCRVACNVSGRELELPPEAHS
jgi:hypothetical protein